MIVSGKAYAGHDNVLCDHQAKHKKCLSCDVEFGALDRRIRVLERALKTRMEECRAWRLFTRPWIMATSSFRLAVSPAMQATDSDGGVDFNAWRSAVAYIPDEEPENTLAGKTLENAASSDPKKPDVRAEILFGKRKKPIRKRTNTQPDVQTTRPKQSKLTDEEYEALHRTICRANMAAVPREFCLAMLVHCESKDGLCRVSKYEMRRMLGVVGDDSIKRRIKAAVDAGVVQIVHTEGGLGRNNVYRIAVERMGNVQEP